MPAIPLLGHARSWLHWVTWCEVSTSTAPLANWVNRGNIPWLSSFRHSNNSSGECCKNCTARHEILRTVFRRETGFKAPVQVVLEFPMTAKGAGGAWEELDLSQLMEAER